VDTCHLDMALPRLADGGDGFWVCKVASQSRTADKRWSSRLVVGRGVNKSSPKNLSFYWMLRTALD